MSRKVYSPSFVGMTTIFRVRELLEWRGMSQSELARQAGVSFPTVNAMCANRTKQVALATLDKIAGVLKVEPGALIVREKPRRHK